jgi:hypothetical protein
VATFTSRLNLRKPATTDQISVGNDLNANWEIVDAHAHSGTYVALVAAPTGVAATDTAALAAAITAAATGSKKIQLQRGIYAINATQAITAAGISISGDGEYGDTIIRFSGTGALFEIGTDDGLAHDRAGYDGVGQFRLADVRIECATSIALTALGNGQGNYAAGTYAIRDWRGGDIQLERVEVRNFDYAFWGIQSDVNRWDSFAEMFCHSGVYLGPRSDQLTATAFYAYRCDQALHLDRVSGARFYGPQFVDCGYSTTKAIKIGSAWSFGSEGISFDDAWFEHLGGYAAGELASFADIGVGDTVLSSDIHFRNPLIATNAAAALPRTTHLVTVGNGDAVSIENPLGKQWKNVTFLFEFVGTTSGHGYVTLKRPPTQGIIGYTQSGSGSPSVTYVQWGALGTAGGISFTGASVQTANLDVATGMTIANSANVALATGAGTKIGTATSQKLGFWNATPVVQLTVSGARGQNEALRTLVAALVAEGLAANTSTVGANPLWTPPTGVLAMSIPRNGPMVAVGSILTSQTQLFTLVYLEVGQVVTNIAFYSGGQAAVNPTNQWFSLYDSSRGKLNVTSDDLTTAWGTETRKSLALASPYTVLTSGYYYVGIMVKAGTTPSLAGVAGRTAQLGRPPILVGTDATNNALTDPASSPTTAAALTVTGNIPYCEIT